MLGTMEGMDTDRDQIQWTGSFMLDRSVGGFMDGHQCEETAVDTGISQGLPVSPIIFAIYLSGVSKEVEKEIGGCMATSFVEDCVWLVETDWVEQFCERLASVVIKAVE